MAAAEMGRFEVNGHGRAQGPPMAAGNAAASAPESFLEVLQEAEVTKAANKLILRKATDPAALLRIVEEQGEALHVLNICTILHRLSRCLARRPQLLSVRSQELQRNPGWPKLMLLVRRHAGICNNMELVNCIWSLATLEMRSEEETVSVLYDCMVQHLGGFDGRNLALSAWALAKLGCTDQTWRWCRLWADASLKRLPDFDTRDMTMVIWAFATIHWKDELFLRSFCEQVTKRVEDYGTQDVGNTIWALATLMYRHEAALAGLCSAAFSLAERFDQQGLSITMWSLATLGYKNMNLMHCLTSNATERIKTFKSQGMSNITWACAKFQFQQKCLLMTVAEEAIPRLDEFDPQHMSILAWAYATLEFPNRPLLTALCRAATRKMHLFSAQHMANMTWAMATLAHKDEEYLQAMTRQALTQAAEFNPQECSNLAWALALLTFRNDELLEILSRRSQEIVEDFIPQNLGNSAWAYNRLGYRDEMLMKTLTRQAARMLPECQGQEILDLLEALGTGGYEDVVDECDLNFISNWIVERSAGATTFIKQQAGLALEWPRLSDFDRALAVQDYRDQLAAFNVIGLGYNYTASILEELGVHLPSGDSLVNWKEAASAAAEGVMNASDASKNAEAQEGLKACRTVCVYRYSLSAPSQGKAARREPSGVASSQAVDAWELGLVAATLKHHRGGDGEFQALQSCARACLDELGLDPLTGAGAAVEGEVWLHVSEVPCLSCVGAMAQFRRLFPKVSLCVSFTLGRSAKPSAGASLGSALVGDNGDASGSNGVRSSTAGQGQISGDRLGAAKISPSSLLNQDSKQLRRPAPEPKRGATQSRLAPTLNSAGVNGIHVGAAGGPEPYERRSQALPQDPETAPPAAADDVRRLADLNGTVGPAAQPSSGSIGGANGYHSATLDAAEEEYHSWPPASAASRGGCAGGPSKSHQSFY
eukprot:TRINITY_DN59034_c0_g1_i2.p1 TRINITY_DN59034_c0_g1~~TRINITY_DN59034_c0_g1_i2.p1  ORF type:complete len:939 (-),score=231.37 TRINITY_DN59034_c0_g1_i2:676-3492(-)